MTDILSRGIHILEGLMTCLESRFPFHGENGLRESHLLSKASLPSFEPGPLTELTEGLMFLCGAESAGRLHISHPHTLSM